MRFLLPWALCLLAGFSNAAHSEPTGVADARRAQVNYMLNCQGCHGPDGAGTPDGSVPAMKGFVGQFLTVPGGRAFLVQVPGSANSALDDASLAEVLNWVLQQMSADSLPARLSPYTALEVGRLRKSPLTDVHKVRSLLLARIMNP